MSRTKPMHCTNPKCEGAACMNRAYIRIYVDGKQQFVPMGWWCPLCGWFMND